MLEQSTPHKGDHLERRKLEEFFITTGFYDLLPLALEIAGSLGQTDRLTDVVQINLLIPIQNKVVANKI